MNTLSKTVQKIGNLFKSSKTVIGEVLSLILNEVLRKGEISQVAYDSIRMEAAKLGITITSKT